MRRPLSFTHFFPACRLHALEAQRQAQAAELAAQHAERARQEAAVAELRGQLAQLSRMAAQLRGEREAAQGVWGAACGCAWQKGLGWC